MPSFYLIIKNLKNLLAILQIVPELFKQTFSCTIYDDIANEISSLAISPAQYADFMIAIFDLWMELDDPEVEIRNIQSVVNLILGGNKRECIYMGQCDQFVTVYFDGSIYSCDFFLKIHPLRFGSVVGEPVRVRTNPSLQRFQKLLKRRKEHCQTCDWYFICQGGCAKDCYGYLDSIEPLNEVCENLKRYFEYILTRIRSYDLLIEPKTAHSYMKGGENHESCFCHKSEPQPNPKGSASGQEISRDAGFREGKPWDKAWEKGPWDKGHWANSYPQIWLRN